MLGLTQVLKMMSEAYVTWCGSALSGITPMCWEEGGEWLPVSQAVYIERKVLRELNEDYVPVNNIGHILTLVEQNEVCAVMMRCGTGKSTSLAVKIHELRLTPITFVVTPSIVTATLLSDYVKRTVRTADTLSGFTCKHGLYYVSAAQVLTWVAMGNDLTDVLFVIDEAHCVTPVYRALKYWLKSVRFKTVLMTASVGSQWVTSSPDCAVKEIPRVDQLLKSGYSDHFAGARALVVGVEDACVCASPANLFIGNTIDLTLVIDTGLRYDPIFENGEVFHGERVAQQSEMIQMMGRIGRGSARGHALAVKTARALPSAKPRLYDWVYGLYVDLLGFNGKERYLASVKGFQELTGVRTTERELSDVSLAVDHADGTVAEAQVELITTAKPNGTSERIPLSEALAKGIVVRHGNRMVFTSQITSVQEDLTYIDVENARDTLARKRIPRYSETEYAAVLKLWGELVKSVRTYMQPEYVAQFREYFRNFSAYDEAVNRGIEVQQFS